MFDSNILPKWDCHIDSINNICFANDLAIAIRYSVGVSEISYHLHRVDSVCRAYERILEIEDLCGFKRWETHTDLIQDIKDYCHKHINMKKLIDRI